MMMDRQRDRRVIRGLFIGLLGALCIACGEAEQGVPEMNEQERQTVEAYTQTLSPVCIGRFQVEMPEQLVPRYSSLTVNKAEISARPMSRAMFKSLVRERKETLEATDPLDDHNRPYLKSINEPGHTIVIMDRNESIHVPDAARVLEGYSFDGMTMFKVEIKATDLSNDKYKEMRASLKTNKSERLKQVEYLLRHLQPRRAGEIPEGPGLCFENGFLAGGAEDPIPGASLPVRDETVAMTLVDRNHPDVYLVLQTDNTVVEEDTLLDRTNNAEQALKKDNNFSVLRRGAVKLEGIVQAEEWLITETTAQDIKGNYFNLEANSRIDSPENPYIDISLRNGEFFHGEEYTAIDKAALTDAEAVGLWDAITRTFRARPGAF